MNEIQFEPPFKAYDGDEPFVFVSYSHQDKAWVYPEIQRLHDVGHRIWYDEGIDPGNEWPDEIAKALEGCAYFIVFISPQSVESKHVKKEIHFALEEEKPFLAIHVEETQLPRGLRYQIGDIQAIPKFDMSII